MHSNRQDRSAHPFRLFALLVVAVLGLSMANPAAAQVVQSSVLATQFFSAVQGEPPVFLISQDALLHTPEGTYSGAEGPAQFGEDFGASFSNVQFAIQSTSETADGAVLTSFTLTGINTGPYRGLSANCSGIAVQGVALFKVEQRAIWTEPWITTSGVRNDLPLSSTVSLVTEQWVSYEADTITSQIAQFNALDPNTRPGCDDSSANGAEPPQEVPSCIPAYRCATP